MNNREILQRAVDWWLAEEKHKYGGAPEWVFAAREELDKESEPAPPRNPLAVDENTPDDTVIWRIHSNSSTGEKVISTKGRESPKSVSWKKYLGIHLLPNPGYGKPPVKGLVLCVSQWGAYLGLARLYPHWNSRCEWAPVKWVDGQLVIREEALYETAI